MNRTCLLISLALASGIIGWTVAAGFCADVSWEPLYEPGCGGAIVSVGVSPHDAGHLIAGGDMLGVGVSFDGGESWLPANKGLTSYEMATPTFHPRRTNEVWIGSCMGPFKSTDCGRSWTPSRNGMPAMRAGRYTAMIEKVLFDPADDARMVAVGGSSRRWGTSECQGAIWLSEDGGEAWLRNGTITAGGFVTDAVQGANVIKAFWGPGPKGEVRLHLVADEAGWFVSTDCGRTWQQRHPQGLAEPLANVACHPHDPDVVWAITGCGAADASGKRTPGRVYKSTDGGQGFFLSDGGMTYSRGASTDLTTHFRDIEVSPVDPDVLYVSDASWSSASIWRSDDGGVSWRKVCRKGQDGGVVTACSAGPACVVVPSPHAAACAYAFNSEYILKTANAGQTWTDMTAIQPDPAKPNQWRGRGWNGWCSQNYVFNPYRRGESMMVAMDGGHGWHSTDGMQTWRYAFGQLGAWQGANDVAFSRDGYIYIATGQQGGNVGVMVSADNGETWTNRYGESCGLPSRQDGTYGFVWANPENGRSAFVVLGDDRYVTEDGGETWLRKPIADGGGDIAADTLQVGRFYIKSAIGVRVTDDWIDFRNLGLEGEAEGRISCDANGRVLVCRGRTARERPGLWRYDPQHGSWTNLHANALASAAAADPSDPKRIILVTNDMPYHDLAGGDGIFISSNDGAKWKPCELGGMMRRFRCVAFDPFETTTVVAGMSGGGFIRGTWERGGEIGDLEVPAGATVTVTEDGAYDAVTVRGTLEVCANLILSSLRVEAGATLEIDGVTLSPTSGCALVLGNLVLKNGGRLASFADVDSDLRTATLSGSGEFTKEGSGTLIAEDPAGFASSVHVKAGRLMFSAACYACDLLRLNVTEVDTKSYWIEKASGADTGRLQLMELAFVGQDGNRVGASLKASPVGTLPAALDYGSATVPEGYEYADVENTRGCTVGSLFDGKDWPRFGLVSPLVTDEGGVTLYMRLPEDSEPVEAMNYAACWGGFMKSWTLSGSWDGGQSWTVLNSTAGYTGYKANDGKSKAWQGNSSQGIGNPIPKAFPLHSNDPVLARPGVRNLPEQMSVQVASGAVLDFSNVTGGQLVNALTVDMEEGAGAISNCVFATEGALRIENFVLGAKLNKLAIPLDLGCADGVKNLAKWTVYVNGETVRPGRYRPTYCNGCLRFVTVGYCIAIR